METEVAKPKIADKSASCHCWMLLAQFQEIAVAFHIRREFAKRTRKGAVLLDLLQKISKNQIRSLLEGLKQFSPRQKVFRCREGSMDLLLDPLAVQKPCIQERSAAFRNFDSGDFGQIQGNHVDSLG